MKITTKYNELPKDVKSAIAQLNALLNISICTLIEKDCVGNLALAEKKVREAYRITQKLMED